MPHRDPRTPTQELATVLLDRDVMEFIHERRKAGETWFAIRDELDEKTNGRVDVTLVTLHSWIRTERELANA